MAARAWLPPRWVKRRAWFHPEAGVELAGGPRLVTGRAASGEERDRLWARWRARKAPRCLRGAPARGDRRRRPGAASGHRAASVRAVVYDRYGPPDVLRVEDVPMPSPAAGQVLVQVAATSVNLSDWETLRGSPLYARLGGLRTPARRTLGSDIAGWVDAVGDGVTRFRPGDEVYGDNLALKGGFAEYAVAAESALALKPAGLTFARGVDAPAGRSDRAAGNRRRRGRAARADQRRRRRLGLVRDPARQAARRARDRRRQRRQARLHAVARRRRGDRLPPRGLHPRRRAVRPRSSTSSRTGRCSRTAAPSPAAAATAASAGPCRALLRVLTIGSVAGRLTGRRMGVLAVQGGAGALRAAGRACASPATSPSTSTARSGSTTSPQALAHVGEGRALGKVVVTP